MIGARRISSICMGAWMEFVEGVEAVGGWCREGCQGLPCEVESMMDKDKLMIAVMWTVRMMMMISLRRHKRDLAKVVSTAK